MSIVSSMESEGRYLSLLHLAQRIVDRRDGVPLLPSDAGPSSSHVSTSVLAAKEQRSGDEVSSFEPLGVDGDAPSPPSSSNPSNTSTQTVNGVVEMTQRKRILSALRFTAPEQSLISWLLENDAPTSETEALQLINQLVDEELLSPLPDPTSPRSSKPRGENGVNEGQSNQSNNEPGSSLPSFLSSPLSSLLSSLLSLPFSASLTSPSLHIPSTPHFHSRIYVVTVPKMFPVNHATNALLSPVTLTVLSKPLEVFENYSLLLADHSGFTFFPHPDSKREQTGEGQGTRDEDDEGEGEGEGNRQKRGGTATRSNVYFQATSLLDWFMEHTTATDRDDARSLFHKFVDGGLVEKLNMKVGEDNDQQEQEIDESAWYLLAGSSHYSQRDGSGPARGKSEAGDTQFENDALPDKEEEAACLDDSKEGKRSEEDREKNEDETEHAEEDEATVTMSGSEPSTDKVNGAGRRAEDEGDKDEAEHEKPASSASVEVVKEREKGKSKSRERGGKQQMDRKKRRKREKGPSPLSTSSDSVPVSPKDEDASTDPDASLVPPDPPEGYQAPPPKESVSMDDGKTEATQKTPKSTFLGNQVRASDALREMKKAAEAQGMSGETPPAFAPNPRRQLARKLTKSKAMTFSRENRGLRVRGGGEEADRDTEKPREKEGEGEKDKSDKEKGEGEEESEKPETEGGKGRRPLKKRNTKRKEKDRVNSEDKDEEKKKKEGKKGKEKVLKKAEKEEQKEKEKREKEEEKKRKEEEKKKKIKEKVLEKDKKKMQNKKGKRTMIDKKEDDTQTETLLPTQVYQTELEIVWERTNDIPEILFATVMWLQENALYVLGIFRISANGITLKEVQEQINHGNFPSLESFADEPHMVSGLLKLWLRVMPTPLCADFEKWSAVSDQVIEKKQVMMAKELVDAMSRPFAVCLDFLIRFCSNVINNQAVNKMSKSNMAAILGPNLMRRKAPSPMSMLKDVRDASAVAVLLFDEYEAIFADVSYPQKALFPYLDCNPALREEDLYTRPHSISSIQRRKSIGVSAKALNSLQAVHFEEHGEGAFAAATESLRDSEDAYWILVGYVSSDIIKLQAHGKGGVENVKPHLSPTQIQYLLLRSLPPSRSPHEDVSASRDVFVVWVGEEVPTMQKGTKRAHRGDVKQIFSPFHTELTAHSLTNLTDDEIWNLSGPNAGTHVID